MHRFNRAIFFKVDGAAPLLRLYTRLVALELTLKDAEARNYNHGHDIVSMVQDRGDAALSVLANALRAALAALHCTDRSGKHATVVPAVYPGVRYLLHESDFPGKTTDADITAALQALEDLLSELGRHGVRPC
jgi:hypothetical protein